MAAPSFTSMEEAVNSPPTEARVEPFVRISVKRSALRIQYDVIHALLIRELQTRFGKFRLSYLWALLEPITYVAVFSLAKLFVGTEISGVDFTLFLLTGIIPWLMFASSMSRAFETVGGNQGLFMYRMVRPFDALMARVILEFMVSITAYIILLILLAWIGMDISIEDPVRLILLVIPLFVFVFGCGLLGMVLIGINPEMKNFIQLPMRGMFWLSGIFYSVDAIPSEYHYYLLWNPMLHILELNRLAFFEVLDESVVSLEYFCLCAVIALWLGLVVYRANVNRLMTKR